MDPTTFTTSQQLMFAAGIGLIVGLVPLIAGIVKRNMKFGLIGFAGSIVGGAILGLILAIPVAAVFTWLVVRRTEGQPSADTVANAGSPAKDNGLKKCPRCFATYAPDIDFCLQDGSPLIGINSEMPVEDREQETVVLPGKGESGNS